MAAAILMVVSRHGSPSSSVQLIGNWEVGA
jgi:hypothetical protein